MCVSACAQVRRTVGMHPHCASLKEDRATMKSKITTTLALSMLLLGGASFAAQQDMPSRQDNTKVNKRDRNKAEPTADQQTENRSDRDIAKDIRKAIVDDKSLSTYAHNVKVIVQNGSVTLKGPVR